MGMCLDGVGGVSIEVRRESFRIAADSWDRREPNPEYPLSDLVNLRDALNEAIEYLEGKHPSQHGTRATKGT